MTIVQPIEDYLFETVLYRYRMGIERFPYCTEPAMPLSLHMPSIEYTCRQCGHEFKRVVFVEDTPSKQTCLKCGSEVEPDKNYSELPTGLESLGALAKDTN
ncbi:MAG: hypothetical protein VR64_01610 [Desulfatitalea sp. BRH_c12]|nr:MAG: hypothetical protein VR64_01610 [Desulfatitalea sp. BRH_c12]